MYHAEKGKGAFCNDERISVSARELNTSLVAFETRDLADTMGTRKRLRERADIINTYSAGFEFVMVASGKFEARICVDPWGNDYDCTRVPPS
jgi:fructose-1,6-bisphosphatase/inositol monophosphatase family enzyme